MGKLLLTLSILAGFFAAGEAVAGEPMQAAANGAVATWFGVLWVGVQVRNGNRHGQDLVTGAKGTPTPVA